MMTIRPVSGYLSLFTIFCTLCFACTKNLTKTNIVYFNDFEDSRLNNIIVSAWSSNGTSFGPVSDTRITPYNGNKVLGRFNNARIDLTLTNLPSHQALRIELDLYIHDKWQNDLWILRFDAADQLLAGFSNDVLVKQSYPNWIGNGLVPAGSNAYNTQLPGACSQSSLPNGTSMYKFVRTVAHTGDTFQVNASDAGNFFNLPCERSWSIDNLKITVLDNF